MNISLSLPNKQGHFHSTKIPQYVLEILLQRKKNNYFPRIHEIGCYQYRIYGYNPQRKFYGIHDDINKFSKWINKYFSSIENIQFHESRNNYYVDFEMFDPIVQQLEKNNLIIKKGDYTTPIKINN